MVGLVLNNVEPVWLIIANMLGVYPALVTSMFGVGLVVLLLYSVKVLHEPVNRKEASGAGIIIAGTIVLGMESFFRPDYAEDLIDTGKSYLFVSIFALVAAMIMIVATRSRNARTIGFAFGIAAGGFGGQDIIFKMLGQLHMNDVIGWIVFASSFIIGFFAFLFTQLGFARKAPASVLVPAYDTSYILVPLLYQALLLPRFQIWWSTVLGAAIIVAGIVLMKAQGSKKEG
jgi:drug/metabolite transporter (DMT)-like permease